MEKFPVYDLGVDRNTHYFHGKVVFSICFYRYQGICGIPGGWGLYYGYQRRNEYDEGTLWVFRSKTRAIIWAKEKAANPANEGTTAGTLARMFLKKVREELKAKK